MSLVSAIKRQALAAGFDLVGIAPPSALDDFAFFRRWLKEGYGGEMRYLADPRREDPRQILPSVKSIICVGLIYNTPYPYSVEAGRAGAVEQASQYTATEKMQRRAWISRYAWGRDYHKLMRKMLEQLRTAIAREAPGAETRVYVDTGPIVERAFARLSGIGWMGKNTCLINEGKGSWFFLGVILTDMVLAPDVAAPDRCGTCTRCLEACPTGALVEPYVMDASRCISYFNIELRGAIPVAFRSAMGSNVFGCDICQDVCPWNNRPLSIVPGPLAGSVPRDNSSGGASSRGGAATTDRSEFQPMQVEAQHSGGHVTLVKSPTPGPESRVSSSGPQVSGTEPRFSPAHFSLFNPRLEDLAALTGEDFRKIFAHSSLKRAKYRGWLRNLCVAMGNSGDPRFVPWLQAAAQSTDALVREHAAWALRKLQADKPLSD